jgi:hypothetical protein
MQETNMTFGLENRPFAVTPFSSVGIERKMPHAVIAGLFPMLDRQ